MRKLLIVLWSAWASSLSSADGQSTALPLDLAFSRSEAVRDSRAVLSPDGRYLAFEVRTPQLKTPDVGGSVEARFLPSGVPTGYRGRRLWVSDVRSSASKAVCGETVTCWRGAWSPSSRQLAFYADEGGEVGLWIYDTATARSRRLGNVRIKAKLWQGDEPAWSPDGRTLYVPVRPPEVDPAVASPAQRAERDPNKPSVLVHRTSVVSEPSARATTAPGRNELFLRENNASLAAVDLDTTVAKIVVPYDAEHRPNNLRLSPDGRWLSYLTVFRTNPDGPGRLHDLVVLPAAGGAPVAVVRDLKMNDGDYFGSTYRWTRDSAGVVFMKNHDLWMTDVPPAANAAPRRLAEGLGKFSELLLLTRDGKGVIVGIEPEGEKNYSSVPPRAFAIVPFDGTAPKVARVTGQPLRADPETLLQRSADSFQLLRDVAGSIDREIVEVTMGTGETKRIWSGRGRFTLVGLVPGSDSIVSRFENLATTPNYYLFDRTFQIVRRLSDVEPRLEALRVGAAEGFDTVLPAPSGKQRTVRTHIFLPSGKKRGDRLPTIVYFYSGSPFSRYAHDFGGGSPNSIPVQVFASRGFAVLFCDVPLGAEGSAGNPVQEMTDAVVAQVYRAAELGYTDIARAAIIGHSYGGYSTAAILSATTLFRAGIAIDGLYDLGGMYAHMDSSGAAFGTSWAESGQGRMGTHPWADQRRYIANSPYYQADKIHAPLLLVHGEKDSVCPVAEAQKMFNALRRLGREAELAIYEGEGHVPSEWGTANAVDAVQRMLDFLSRHLREQQAVE